MQNMQNPTSGPYAVEIKDPTTKKTISHGMASSQVSKSDPPSESSISQLSSSTKKGQHTRKPSGPQGPSAKNDSFSPLSNKSLTPYQKRVVGWWKDASDEERFQYQLQQERMIHGTALKALRQGFATQKRVDAVSRKTDTNETNISKLREEYHEFKKYANEQFKVIGKKVDDINVILDDHSSRITTMEGEIVVLKKKEAFVAKTAPEMLQDIVAHLADLKKQKDLEEQAKRDAENQKKFLMETGRNIEHELFDKEAQLHQQAAMVQAAMWRD